MSEKPTTPSVQNHRKRKLEDVPPVNEEHRDLKSQQKAIEREQKKARRQNENQHVGDKVKGVERTPSMTTRASNDENQEQAQLLCRASHEADIVYPTILPGFIKQSSAAQTNPYPSAKRSLCRRCAKIDLDTLLSRSHKTQAGQPAKNLSPVPSWDQSCTLCSLFHSTLRPVWSTEPTREKVPLRTYSSNKMKDKVWGSISTNLLQTADSKRYIVSQPEGVGGPVKIIKDKIDSFDCVKDWISLCSSQHRICDLEVQSSSACRKLIDCETRGIVPGENRPYVALSYVWGPSSVRSEDPDRLPADLPNTIQDAMTVTQKIGYRYLWVDRYCIDQGNEQETEDQVGKMDSIYNRAELTIIAAIGDDPNYGLPGVSLQKRMRKHLTACAKVGKHFLISIEASPKTAIKKTRWTTRAWTYQEGLFSRRRLVFSKQQMYFECYGMYCCESLHLPLETLHRKDMQGFKSVFCSEKRVGIFPKGVGTTATEIVERIEEYSKLNLSHPSDILNGMLGIFHAFEIGRLRIHHCGGIPLIPLMPEKSAGKPITEWTRAIGFFRGLFWDLESRSDRRPGFPSWSWTGWYGPVKWGGIDCFSFKVDPNVQVRVELVDGQLLALEDLHTESMRSGIPKIVHITAWTIGVKILECWREEANDSYTARVELEDGGYLKWQFQSFSNAKITPGKCCKGIILGCNWDPPLTRDCPEYVILVCGKFGNTMERIGLGCIVSSMCERYDKDGVEESKGYLTGEALIKALLTGGRISSASDTVTTEPPELVKLWEEIQLG